MAIENEAPPKSGIEPKPLRKRTVESQTLYCRRPEVEAQIRQALSHNADEIQTRLEVVDQTDERFLKSETLIYLLREFFERGENDMFNAIYETLSERIYHLLRRHKIKFAETSDFEDFLQDVQLIMLDKILDFESDHGDYAQVSFGDFVVTIAVNEIKKYFGKLKQAAEMIALDEENEEDKPKFELVAQGLSSEKMLVLREAIGNLPDHIREVAFLHYVEGWQIDSQNPHEPTLSKKYQKSEKTIRNWLRKAAELLSDWKGEIKR